jgi:hypothetical protein
LTASPADDDRASLRAAVTLALLAVLRLLLPFTPDRFFDVDPASVSGPFPALGPGGSMLVDAVILVVAGSALTRLARRGPGIDPLLVVLGLLPLPIVLWHARGDVLQAWRGLDWFAAAALGVAMAHLVRVPSSRRAVAAILVGGIAAMGVRGGWQVFGEHADTVAYFDAHRDEVLAARGWAEDSAAALAFERRLRQPEATGWVGFSNVFSGLAGAGSILLLATLAAWRVRRRGSVEAGGPVVLGLVGVGLAMLIGLNGSKGAIVACGVALPVAVLALGPWSDADPRRLARLAIGAAMLALLAIAVRGLLPEDALGDRSLLFRWHYAQGATSIFAEQPVVGVGPDGFQDAYLRHKPLRSPENVASAHSVAIDWLASLGVVGLAWLGLAMAIVLRRSDDASELRMTSDTPPVRIGTVGVAVVGVVAVLIAQAVVEAPSDGGAIGVRMAAVSVGALVGVAMHGLLQMLDAGTVRRVAIAAAAVVLVQAQIEMLFWQPGSVAICWAMLAVAGDAVPRSTALGRLAGPILLGAGVIAAVLGSGELKEDRRAERALAPLFDASESPGGASAEVRRSIATGISSLSADEVWWDDRVIRGAIDQFMAAGSDDDLRQAMVLTERWCERRPGPESWSTRAAVMRAAAARDLAESEVTLEALDVAIAFDTTEPRRWIERAELLVTLERLDDARTAIDEARRLDAARELDPLMQLSDRERARLERLATEAAQEPRP